MNDTIPRPGSGRHPVGLLVVVGLHVALAAALMVSMKLKVPPTHVEPPVGIDPPLQKKAPEPDPLPQPPKWQPPTTSIPVPPIPPVTADPDPGTPTYRHPEGEAPGGADANPGPAGIVTPEPPRPAPHAKPARIDASAASCRPEYPAIAQREGATGVSRIRFTVDATGHVVRAETLKSAGPTRAHRLLDRAAADALQSCPITVGTDENGRPVGTTVEVEYAWVQQ